MEERKRRIARKYLRERADITYSEEQVPGDESTPSDEELLAAENLDASPDVLERQDSVPQAYRPIPMRRPVPMAENPNWLLADPEEERDPFADPFGMEEEESGSDNWTSRDTGSETSQTYEERRESDLYRYRNEAVTRPSSMMFNGDGQQSLFGQRSRFDVRTPAELPSQQGRQSLSGAPGEGIPNESAGSQPLPYNTRALEQEFEEDPSAVTLPWNTVPEATFNQSQQTYSYWGSYTPYQSAYQTQQDQRQEQWGSYIPYRSSLETQQDQRLQQRQQQWGNFSPPQRYERPNAYQEWKRQTAPQYDPTSADAYTREMMPQTRR